MKNKVILVLVSYNDAKYLPDFFDSFSKQNYPDLSAIFVDNASADNSAELAEQYGNTMQVIRLKENIGFGRGCNIGVQYALKQGADYVLLLNLDTTYDENLVSELVKYSNGDAVTTAITYCDGHDGTRSLWYSGGEIDWTTGNVNQLLLKDITSHTSSAFDVNFISGCCMMIPRQVIEKVGLFDDDYYLYYEDTDFCVRLKEQGIRMRCVTTTSVWHKVGGSSLGGDEMSCSTQYYIVRNRLLFSARHAVHFSNGNLGVLQSILQERAFFDGLQNEKYELYVRAAIADYIKSFFGKGRYGKTLISEHFWIGTGFYEKEEEKGMAWYWAKEPRAKIYLANSNRIPVVFHVSFSLASAQNSEDDCLTLIWNDTTIGSYQFPAHVDFSLPLSAEGTACLDFLFRGESCLDAKADNGRHLYFQVSDFVAEQTTDRIYWSPVFYEEETKNDEKWRWSVKEKADVKIAGLTSKPEIAKISFQIDGKTEFSENSIQLYQNGIEIAEVEPKRLCNIPVKLYPNKFTSFQFATPFIPTMEKGRAICFQIRNFKVDKCNEMVFWGSTFDMEESDEDGSWRWNNAQNGEVRIANPKSEVMIKRITFSIVPFNKNAISPVELYIDGMLMKHFSAYEYLDFPILLQPFSIAVLQLKSNFPIERDCRRGLCFQIRDFRMTDNFNAIIWGASFYQEEADDFASWRWSPENENSFIVGNITNNYVCKIFKLEIIPAKSQTAGTVKVYQENVQIAELNPNNKCEVVAFLPPTSLTKISFKTNFIATQEDMRTLCFQMRNFCEETSTQEYPNGNIIYGSTFFAEESDGMDCWHWNSCESGTLFLMHTNKIASMLKITLQICPVDNTQMPLEIYWREQFQGEYMPNEKIELRLPIEPFEVQPLRIHAEWPICTPDDRMLCFRVYNPNIEII